jgi:ATP-dependent DNA helicase 2 subunit 1
MFESSNDSTKTCFKIAIEAALESMKRYAIADPSVKIGVLLFGTSISHNSDDISSIFELCPLTNPNIQNIEKLRELASSEEKIRELLRSDIVPSERPLPVGNALWASYLTCRGAGSKELDLKTVFLITNDDCKNLSGDHIEAAKNRSENCAKFGIEVIILPIACKSRSFDVSYFWADLQVENEISGKDESNKVVSVVVGHLEGDSTTTFSRKFVTPSVIELTSRMQDDINDQVKSLLTRRMKKRISSKIPFMITDGVYISVGLYHTFKAASKPAASSKQESDTGRKVEVRTRYADPSTGVDVEKYAIKKVSDLGGGTATFSLQESKKYISNVVDVKSPSIVDQLEDNLSDQSNITPTIGRGLRLIGFRSMTSLPPSLNVKPSVFCYPIENDINGSTKLFRALWEKMLHRKKIAICRYFPRNVGENPRMVALWPAEEISVHSMQIQPPGMYMITLPFVEDVRVLPSPSFVSSSVNDEILHSAVDMVRSLKNHRISKDDDATYYENWDILSSNMTNPAIRKFYFGLEAFALLEKENPWNDELHDTSKPDKAGATLAAESSISGFRSLVQVSPSVQKKEAKKRAVVDESHEQETGDVKLNFDALEKHTLIELKSYLKSKKQPVSGTKAVLLDRIKGLGGT